MVMVININSHRLRKEERTSRGDPIEMKEEQNDKMIDKVSMIIGCLVWLIRCMILRVSARIKRGISGREGCQCLVSLGGSIGDLRREERADCGIKGVDRMSWLTCLTNLTVIAGICVGVSIHVYLTALSDLLTSRGSLRLGYRLYRAKSLPSTGRTVRAIKSIRLNKVRDSYVYL